MSSQSEVAALKKELLGLFQYMQRVRQEIAAINRPVDEEHQFDSMAEQLDAIVAATEKATNTIMEMMEKNGKAIDQLRGMAKSKKVGALLDGMESNQAEVFEACSFQDITGQRINKVAKSLTYVETRVGNLIDIWGKAELDSVEVMVDKVKTEDEKLLEGPQLEGKGLSQDDIDALFD